MAAGSSEPVKEGTIYRVIPVRGGTFVTRNDNCHCERSEAISFPRQIYALSAGGPDCPMQTYGQRSGLEQGANAGTLRSWVPAFAEMTNNLLILRDSFRVRLSNELGSRTPGLFHQPDFAIIFFRPGMERDRQTERRLGDSDILSCRICLGQQIEVVEQQFCHPVDKIIADPLTGDEESLDHGGRDRRGLSVITARGNGSGDVTIADFRDHFGRDQHEHRPAGGKNVPNKLIAAQSAHAAKIRVERAFFNHPPPCNETRVIDPWRDRRGSSLPLSE